MPNTQVESLPIAFRKPNKHSPAAKRAQRQVQQNFRQPPHQMEWKFSGQQWQGGDFNLSDSSQQ